MEFAEKASQWLALISKLDEEHFAPVWDYQDSGLTFPLYQHMRFEGNHKILGVQSKYGRISISEEHCYYVCCPDLDEGKLNNYLSWLNEAADRYAEDLLPGYDFIFVGMVIITSGFNDKKLQKTVKHYKCSCNSKIAFSSGWLDNRLCIVDLADNTIYCSKFGDGLKTRINNF